MKITSALSILALAAFLVPAAAAAPHDQVVSSQMTFQGDVALEGAGGLMLSFEPLTGTAPLVSLDGTASTVTAYTYSHCGISAVALATPGYDCGEARVLRETDATIASEVASAGFEMRVFPGAGGFELSANTGAAESRAARGATISSGGIEDGAIEQQELGPSFTAATVTGDALVMDLQGSTSLHISGDVTIELYRLPLTVVTDAKQDGMTVFSGDEESPGMVGLGMYERVIARLFVEDAELTFTRSGGDGQTQVAMKEATVSSAGAHLKEATGSIPAPGGPVDVRDEELRVAVPTMWSVAPSAGRVQAAWDSSAQPAVATSTDAGFGWMIGLVALLAAVPIGGAAFAIRRARPAGMDRIEAWIESGSYEKAARKARILLEAQPDREDAILGRAIALSKGGKPETAVAEIQHFLHGRQASDGALYYVLGLALLDLGQQDRARHALQDAARLTPTLLPDIHARMGESGAPGGVAYA